MYCTSTYASLPSLSITFCSLSSLVLAVSSLIPKSTICQLTKAVFVAELLPLPYLPLPLDTTEAPPPHHHPYQNISHTTCHWCSLFKQFNCSSCEVNYTLLVSPQIRGIWSWKAKLRIGCNLHSFSLFWPMILMCYFINQVQRQTTARLLESNFVSELLFNLAFAWWQQSMKQMEQWSRWSNSKEWTIT